MSVRVAFIGFRHGHINSLYELLRAREDVEIVAACEEDAAARAACAEKGVAITHDSYAAMLADVDCDVVACGDYYGIRGERLIAAMEAGRHVVADKPVCTRLDELDRIEALSNEKSLCVSCMLDLGLAPQFQTLRRVLSEGLLGDVHVIHFNGQHPLNYGKRPGWYFEEGKHGGTINDLAIHAIDAIPWMTGRAITEVLAARVWNARLPEHPHFQDGAVMMAGLDNGGVVTGDVSYLAPEERGYSLPSYWRFDIAGTNGHAETSSKADNVTLYLKGSQDPRVEPLDPGRPGGYWDDFVAEMRGAPNREGIHTARVIQSTRTALGVQRAGDTGEFPRTL